MVVIGGVILFVVVLLVFFLFFVLVFVWCEDRVNVVKEIDRGRFVEFRILSVGGVLGRL